MQEKADLLYKEYLTKKLDSIFTVQEKNDKYTIVKLQGQKKYNVIDENGKLISDVWYSSIEVMDNGNFKVEKETKKAYVYNVMNKNGKLSFHRWYYSISDIGDNYIVKPEWSDRYEYNYINAEGYSLLDGGYIIDFVDGYSVVKKNGTYNFLDQNGNYYYKSWQVSKNYPNDFNIKITRNEQTGKYDIKDRFNGELVSDISYDNVGEFHYGYAIVEKDGKHNFIDKTGQLVSDMWYDKVNKFKSGLAVVKKAGKCNYIDKNGKLISNTWYDNVSVCYDGYAIVKKDGKYNFLDRNGKLLSDTWYDEIREFKSDSAIVKKDGKCNCIDRNGKLISDTWYDGIRDFDGNSTLVRNGNQYNWMDNQGRLLNRWQKGHCTDMISMTSNFIKYKDKNVFCYTKNLGDYKGEKKLFGYQCTSAIDSFKIKYEPIKTYGSKLVLCYDHDKVFAFNRSNNKYMELGTIETIEFDDNFIIDNYNNRVYFVNNDLLHDVTQYYNSHIKDKKVVSVKKDIPIISKDDFYIHTEDEIRELVKKDKEAENKKQEEIRNKEKEKELQRVKEQDELEKNSDALTQKEALIQLQKVLSVLESINQKSGTINRIDFDKIFFNVADHREIKPDIITNGILKYIDLSKQTFKNVKIAGVDFRKTNILLNPQEVYNKDLRGCNFEGLFIPAFMDFDGVDLRGAKFGRDNNPKTLDGCNKFIGAIYDETTTFDGIPFTELYGEKEVESSRSR